MTVGDMFDLLEEKLRTGEFSRMDQMQIIGESQSLFEFYPVEGVEKTSGDTVQIGIDGYISEYPPLEITASDLEEIEENAQVLKETLDEIRDLLDEAEEINMANYDVDQVAALNNFYIQVWQVLEGKTDAPQKA